MLNILVDPFASGTLGGPHFDHEAALPLKDAWVLWAHREAAREDTRCTEFYGNYGIDMN
jgi:hypothetical protein